MTKPKTKATGPTGPGAFAYWLDQTVPDLTDALVGTAIDVGEFTKWLGPYLGVCRGAMEALSERPQVAAVVKWMLEAERDVAASIDDGRFGRMPPLAIAAAWHAAYKGAADWDSVVRHRDTASIAMFLNQGREALQRQKAKRGRTSHKSRDVLLAAIIDRLKAASVLPADAEGLAEQILIRCRIPVPEESVARAARRGRT